MMCLEDCEDAYFGCFCDLKNVHESYIQIVLSKLNVQHYDFKNGIINMYETFNVNL